MLFEPRSAWSDVFMSLISLSLLCGISGTAQSRCVVIRSGNLGCQHVINEDPLIQRLTFTRNLCSWSFPCPRGELYFFFFLHRLVFKTVTTDLIGLNAAHVENRGAISDQTMLGYYHLILLTVFVFSFLSGLLDSHDVHFDRRKPFWYVLGPTVGDSSLENEEANNHRTLKKCELW